MILKHQDDVEWMKFVQNAAGAILGPMDSWLVLRGTKTLTDPHGAHQRERAGASPSILDGAPEGEADDLSGPAVAPASRAGAASRCAASAG